MVVDTSALLAVFFNEPAAEALLDTIEHDDVRAISTASLFEAIVVVLARKGADALESLEELTAALRPRSQRLHRSGSWLRPAKRTAISVRAGTRQLLISVTASPTVSLTR